MKQKRQKRDEVWCQNFEREMARIKDELAGIFRIGDIGGEVFIETVACLYASSVKREHQTALYAYTTLERLADAQKLANKKHFDEADKKLKLAQAALEQMKSCK